MLPASNKDLVLFSFFKTRLNKAFELYIPTELSGSIPFKHLLRTSLYMAYWQEYCPGACSPTGQAGWLKVKHRGIATLPRFH